MNFQLHYVSFLLLLVLPCFVLAEDSDDPRFWLERMANASHTLNYEGTFVYLEHGQMQSLKVTHGVDSLGEWERLVTLSGELREINVKNGRLVYNLPNKKPLVVTGSRAGFSFPILDQSQLKQLSNFYDFTLQGKDRVAGLVTRKLSVLPRDQYRYGYNVWLAENSGLLLRSEMTIEEGSPVEQFIFTSISLSGKFHNKIISNSRANKEEKKHHLSWHPSTTNKSYRWAVAALPPGFVLRVHRRHNIPASNKPVEHMVFTDGLASVSVYIENDNKNKPNQSSKMGAVSIVSKVVDDHRIVVVGEVPLVTVEYIAKSVHRRSH